MHSVEESSDTLAFATEPVLGSLANIFDYLDERLPQITPKLRDYNLLDFEIKYGLLQVSGCRIIQVDVVGVRRQNRDECWQAQM